MRLPRTTLVFRKLLHHRLIQYAHGITLQCLYFLFSFRKGLNWCGHPSSTFRKQALNLWKCVEVKKWTEIDVLYLQHRQYGAQGLQTAMNRLVTVSHVSSGLREHLWVASIDDMLNKPSNFYARCCTFYTTIFDHSMFFLYCLHCWHLDTCLSEQYFVHNTYFMTINKRYFHAISENAFHSTFTSQWFDWLLGNVT